MGVAFQIQDATFPDANTLTSLTAPFRNGLLGEYVLGVNQAKTIRNRENAAAPMTVVGSPVYGSQSVAVSSANDASSAGFDTGIATTSNRTIIALRRAGVGAGPVFSSAGTYASVGIFDADGYFAFGDGHFGGAYDHAQIARPADDGHTFYFNAGVGTIGVPGTLYVGLSGSLSSDVAGYAGVDDGGQTYKFGVGFNSNFGWLGNIAYGAIFDRMLSADEVGQFYASLKRYYTALGMTVA